MKRIVLALAAAGAMTGTNAFAEGYIGGAAAAARINFDCAGTTSCDNSARGFKLYGGMKFRPGMAAEVTYFDFGKGKAVAPVSGTDVNVTVGLTGLGVGVAFIGNSGPDWSGVVRTGIAYTRMKLTGSVPGFSATDSESSGNVYVGLGVGYKLSPAVTLTGEFDLSRGKYGDETISMRMLSVGLNYGF